MSTSLPSLSLLISVLFFAFYADDCLPDDEGTAPGSGVRCSDASEWLDSHLRLNECLYPPCPLSSASSFTPLSSPRRPLQGVDCATDRDRDIPADRDAGEAACMQHSSPIRRVVPLSSPQSREPTVVHGSGSTVFNVLTVDETEEAGAGLQVPSKLHSASSDMSATAPGGGLSSMGSEEDLLDALKLQQQSDSSSYPGCASSVLRPALVHGCTRMTIYLLGAYSTLTVSSCVDCEIVVGAVSGFVMMNACERVHITVACRKMILWSCHDCEIKIATLTPTILSGDCRGLVFGKSISATAVVESQMYCVLVVTLTIGPFNTTYRLLRVHLRLAQLTNLMSSAHITSGQNCWHEVYDVGTCVDTPSVSPPGSTASSPRVGMSSSSSTFLSAGLRSGETDKGALSSGLIGLPRPPESISSLQNPEKYNFLSVPHRQEYQPLEVRGRCPPPAQGRDLCVYIDVSSPHA